MSRLAFPSRDSYRGDNFTTDMEWYDFGWICMDVSSRLLPWSFGSIRTDPASWTPGRCICPCRMFSLHSFTKVLRAAALTRSNEEVRTRNNRLRRCGTWNDPCDSRTALETSRHCVTVYSHNRSLGEQPHCHQERSRHHDSTPRPIVHEEERRDRHHYVLDIKDCE